MAGLVNYKIDLTDINKLSKKLTGVIYDECRFGLFETVVEFEKDFKQSNLRDNWRNQSRQHLAMRSGDLIESMGTDVIGDTIEGLTARAKIGGTQTSKYAEIQEYGGTIRPKSARYLTVPVMDRRTQKYHALTRAGRAKWINTRAQDLDLLVRKKGGKTYLFMGYKEKKGKVGPVRRRKKAVRQPRSVGRRIVQRVKRSFKRRGPQTVSKDIFVYSLRDSVKIRGRMGFVKGWKKFWGRNGDATLQRITERIHDHFK